MTLRRPFCSRDAELRSIIKGAITKTVAQGSRMKTQDTAVYRSIKRAYSDIEDNSKRARAVVKKYRAYRRLRGYRLEQSIKEKALDGVIERAIGWADSEGAVIDGEDEAVEAFIIDLYSDKEKRYYAFADYERRRDLVLEGRNGDPYLN